MFRQLVRWSRPAMMLLVLAVTGTQQLVAQVHWHAVPAGQAVVAAPLDDSGASTHEDCLLCRVATHAGAVAPPPVSALFAAGIESAFSSASYDEADVPAVPGHAWQSRGPPAA